MASELVEFRRHNGIFCKERLDSLLLADAVEKVVVPGGVCPLGYFDPAGMSRLTGLSRLIGGKLDADATEVIVSDLRQAMRAAGRVVARGFGAPGS